MDYTGFVFIGLMNSGGVPKVIEYNVRMGDPETEVVLPRIKSDFVSLLEAAARSTLASQKLEVEPFTAATVMLVAGGYPDAYEKGKEISFTDSMKSRDHVSCRHQKSAGQTGDKRGACNGPDRTW